MRLGVLDVGSNTVHLLVVDAHPGAAPMPTLSHKMTLRLAEHLTDSGDIAESGISQLIDFLNEASEVAEDRGCQSIVAFATSAFREAPNGQDALNRVLVETKVDLHVLDGSDEARLTFYAIRRWFGWSAGRMLMFDIGGGSLEIAVGADEIPDVATSVALGAGRVARTLLDGVPPSPESIKQARKHIRATIAHEIHDLNRGGSVDTVVGSSKTFRSLARVCGAAPYSEGPLVKRTLKLSHLSDIVVKLADMTADETALLPGVSTSRASQMFAGALVAEAAMDLLDVPSLQISPWALREGIILRHIDRLSLQFSADS